MEYEEAPAPALALVKKLLPLIAVIIALAGVAFVWLYVIPWPAKLTIIVLEKDTDNTVPGATVTVSGISESISPEEGPVQVPSRTNIIVSSEPIAGYSTASSSVETEPGKEYEVVLELARTWKTELTGPASLALPQTCKVEVPINVKNNEAKALKITLLTEGIDEKYSPTITPAEQEIAAGDSKTFTLALNAPLEKEGEHFEGVVRVKKTSSQLKITFQPMAKAQYDVSASPGGSEIVCPAAAGEPPCYRLISIKNRGTAPLPILVEWTEGTITPIALPENNIATVPPEGEFKFGVSAQPPSGFAWIVFHVASKGCATKQIPVKQKT